MTALYALPTSSVPIVAMEPVYVTPADVPAAFTAAGVRVVLFGDGIYFDFANPNRRNEFKLEAFEKLEQLPGQIETLKRYLDR